LEQALARTVPLIQTDEGRLRQILVNLVGNAVKFTSREGRVEVAADRTPGGDKVAIVVRDDGIGMSADDIRAALDPFGQARAGSMMGRGGTGLGLPISKMLVERLGGTFELASQPGRGTTATVLLPV
jgi:signal transduction histidine kinase